MFLLEVETGKKAPRILLIAVFVRVLDYFFKIINFFQYQVFKWANTYFTNTSRKKAMSGTSLNTHTLISSGSL